MTFENYKKQFDDSFSKVKPADFVKKMEGLGYEFEDYLPIKTQVYFSVEIIPSKPKQFNYFNLLNSLSNTPSYPIITNWNLPNDLINIYAKGITLAGLYEERSKIDFHTFSFQESLNTISIISQSIVKSCKLENDKLGDQYDLNIHLPLEAA